MIKILRDRIIGFLIDTAVLYYVSCCLLLLGAYSMMHSPWLPGGFVMRYCETYGIFLSYVIMLTGLCLLVLRRLSLAEDGLVMAGMSLLLLLDPTFFNNVFYTYSLNVGLAVNSFCFLLGVGLYAALMKIGGIPWTKRSATVTAVAAIFVYYYPVGLNAHWPEITTQRYFYWLWWTPLVVAIICEQMHEMVKRSSAPAIADSLRQRFLAAGILIVFYIILSHLLEANYAYPLEFHVEYLTPVLLATGLLFFKLRPYLGMHDWKFIWSCAFLAGCCSCASTEGANTEGLIVNLPGGIALSPFRCGLGAVALLFLYFWKMHRGRSYAVAAAACLLSVVSGSSLSDCLFNIFHFHFVPFFFLALVFAACSIIERTPILPALAGGCLTIAILSLVPVWGYQKWAIFLQTWAIWIGLVQWHYHRYARQRIYSILGAFVFSLTSVMCLVSHHRAWGADYLIVIIGLFCAGRFLKNSALWGLALFGAMAGPLYLSRQQLVSAGKQFRHMLSSGLLVTILAFFMLPLAYYMSVLKKRRQANR